MTISAGTRLGPYEIISPIGAGGMGEVYKARDTRLDRSVALKILPAEFAENAQLKSRFEREARTISQLNHPHICTLYDVGDDYLVMELIEGESLDERLARGPLPLTDVLTLGSQIAEALAKAHREGVIHRDLKPGNVMLTKSGAKLLDFGLAKSGASGLGPRAAEAATEHKPLTQEGTIIGTFQYMAPEQLEGVEADARTDIFALGAVLYEMITGKRAFQGKTKTSLIAAIVSADPKPISAIHPLTPPAFEHVVARCLEKDPDDRWQSAHDVAEELRWIAKGEESPSMRRRSRVGWPLAMIAVLLIGVAAGAYFARPRGDVRRLLSTEITPPEGQAFNFEESTATLSPDGKTLAFVAKASDGAGQIWLRPLDSTAARPLKGTDNASFLFWSPDNKSIAFFADGKLRRIDVAAGGPETIAEASAGRGGAWSRNGTILFTPTPASAVYAVAAAGGNARPVTEMNFTRGETSQRFPVFLPDGDHFLAYLQGVGAGEGGGGGGNVLLSSLGSKQSKTIMTADAGVLFAPPDHVLFVRDRILRDQQIDMKRFEPVGDAVPLADGIQVSNGLNFMNVSVSDNGLLTYVRGLSSTLTTLTFYDARGVEKGTVGTATDQLDPRLSPDEHAIAVARSDASGIRNIWSYDLRRNMPLRLTYGRSNEFAPVWSPDSKSIVYTSFNRRPGDLFIKRVDGSGDGIPLYADRRRKVPTDWSRDGNYIIYHALTPGASWDIEAYSLRDKKVIPIVHGPHPELNGHISPDGHWLAYVSLEAGPAEVYVQAFPAGADRWQISGGGGFAPLWSRDGRELYFISRDLKLMAATVHFEQGFAADAPRQVLPARVGSNNGGTRNQFDVTRDGRFLLNQRTSGPQQSTPITLVENWTAKLPKQ
ncbi:MAG: hypothetical protein NVSMB68_05060 [Thermoanaerobaculia bacterium]